MSASGRDPESPAIADGDQSLTYGELTDRASRIVSLFDDMGLEAGDRLLVVMQNTLDATLVYWATQLAGLVFTPANWRVKGSELDYFLTDCGAAAVIYSEVAAEALADSAAAASIPTISVEGDGTAASLVTRALQYPPALGLPRANAQMLSVLLYTSGTTGPGKGVPRTHAAERAAAIAHVAQNAYVLGESILGVMPLYHTMGVRSLLSMALVNGLFACQHRFDAAKTLDLIQKHRLSALYLVPTLYHDILAQDDFSELDMSTVRKLGFAGAPMTEGLLRRVHATFEPEIFVNHYGSSEIYTFTVDQKAQEKPGSAGKAGMNSEIRIIPLDAEDTDGTVSKGQPGQIIARLSSDEAFAGYWLRPDADAKALKSGWYLTGDVGFLDDEGDLFVTGRVDDMIISGGENILPTEIESVLSLHPDVEEVAVVGQSDERLGQKVVAFVRAGNCLDEAALDHWCKESSLADFKRPRDYVFVDEIPKSPVGKVLRRKLSA